MAMSSAEITSAITECCGEDAFEQDILEYMVSILVDEPPDTVDSMWDLIGHYLEELPSITDEKAGKALCGKMLSTLRPGSDFAPPPRAKGKAKAKGKAGGTALAAPIKLGSLIGSEDTVKADFADAWSVGAGGSSSAYIEEMPQEKLKKVAAIGQAKKEKAARRVERKAWRADSKTEHDSIWVDLPPAVSVGSGGSVDFHLERVNLVNKKGSCDLLSGASATFAQGRRYGLLGRNGVGKSTFLDAVARRELPGVPACSIFYVRQEVEGDDRVPLQWVLQADGERQALLTEKEKLEKEGAAEAGQQLALVYQKLEELDGGEGHSREKRASQLLANLGFNEDLLATEVKDLSGGWRMRVALACALFVSPGLLLLDEPTNHLDLETVMFLENYLATEFHQTLLVVSHDRMFLNEVVTDIVLFENEKLEVYRGDYRSFEAVREEHRLRQERLHEQQEMKREHLQEYITKHAEAGSNGCKAAAQRKARMRKLERLGMEAQASIDGRKLKLSYDGAKEDVAEAEKAVTVTLNFPDPGVCDSLGNPLLMFDDVAFGYGDKPALFQGVSFTMDQSSRVAILGKNGSGKSTLIKLLLGKLKPRSGRCERHRGAKIEYIAQHHLDELDGDSSALKMALDRFPGDGSNSHELKMRQHLGHFGFGGDVLPHQSIRTLSGGQKFRVSLALAMYRKPHLLIMDEPTNHLDLETIDAMVSAIQSFQGGIILVSHDEHLIASACKELRLVQNKRVTQYKGSIADYKKLVLSGKI